MADITVDGTTRVYYVAAISNTAAPTVAELNLGIALHATMTPDGLMGFEAETADVDNSALDSTFDTVTIGRDSFSGTGLMLKKQTGTDTIYDTLTRGAAGYIVVRRYIASSTSWAAAQKASVFPIICGQAKEPAPEKNTVAKYFVPTKITSTPVMRATVAA